MGEIRHVLLARLLSLLVPSVSRAYHEGGQSALFHGKLPTVELFQLKSVRFITLAMPAMNYLAP